MTRRTRLMLVVVLGAVAALGAVKTRQIQAMVAQASSFQPPPEAVTTTVAREEPWPTTISAIGTVRAVRGVVLSAATAPSTTTSISLVRLVMTRSSPRTTGTPPRAVFGIR